MDPGYLNDRWIFLYILLPLVVPVSLILCPVVHVPDLLTIFVVIPVLIVCAILVIIIRAVAFVKDLRGRLWRRSISFILFPILVAVFVSLTRPLLFTGDTLSFYPMYPTFERKVNSITGAEKDKLVVFTMDGWLSTARGFAFDGSDELALPAGEQSQSWKMRAKGTELECGHWEAKHIFGHYYSWGAWC